MCMKIFKCSMTTGLKHATVSVETFNMCTAVTDSKDKELMKVEKRRGVVWKSDPTQSLFFSVKTLLESFTVKSDIFKSFSTLCGVQWLNGSSLHILVFFHTWLHKHKIKVSL